jgi:hypothetical protein
VLASPKPTAQAAKHDRIRFHRPVLSPIEEFLHAPQPDANLLFRRTLIFLIPLILPLYKPSAQIPKYQINMLRSVCCFARDFEVGNLDRGDR